MKEKDYVVVWGHRGLWERASPSWVFAQRAAWKPGPSRTKREATKGMPVGIKVTLFASSLVLGQAFPFSSFLRPGVAATQFWWSVTNPLSLPHLLWSVEWRREESWLHAESEGIAGMGLNWLCRTNEQGDPGNAVSLTQPSGHCDGRSSIRCVLKVFYLMLHFLFSNLPLKFSILDVDILKSNFPFKASYF